MKEIGNFMFGVGVMYALFTFTGTRPTVETWWAFLIVGIVLLGFSWRAEDKARQSRRAQIEADLRAVHERHERARRGES